MTTKSDDFIFAHDLLHSFKNRNQDFDVSL